MPTSSGGLRYPASTDAVNVPGDLQNLAEDVDTNKATKNVSTNAQSTSFTIGLTDAGKVVEMGSGSAITLTIPHDNTTNFPTGTKVDVLRTGTGEVTIAGATSPGTVTVNSEGSKLRINAQWQAVTLIKRAANTWVAVGALKT